mmetsp:Transcript_29049/g.41607  ORF Transcript_29049/g.41607 Transcript_29049/m.41607 type:complete len:132 (-) Transcript_29049:588-983(-)
MQGTIRGTDFVQASSLQNQAHGTTQSTATKPRTNPTNPYSSGGVDLESFYRQNVTTIKTFDTINPGTATETRTLTDTSTDPTPIRTPNIVEGSQETGTKVEAPAPVFKLAPENGTSTPGQQFYTYAFQLSF